MKNKFQKIIYNILILSLTILSFLSIKLLQQINNESIILKFINTQNVLDMLTFAVSIWALYGIYIGFLQYITQDSQNFKYMYLGKSKLDYLINSSKTINLSNTLIFKTVFFFLIIIPFVYDILLNNKALLHNKIFIILSQNILYAWQSCILITLVIYILLIKKSINIMNSMSVISNQEVIQKNNKFRKSTEYFKSTNKKISQKINKQNTLYEKINTYLNIFKQDFPELNYKDEYNIKRKLYLGNYFNTKKNIEESKKNTNKLIEEILHLHNKFDEEVTFYLKLKEKIKNIENTKKTEKNKIKKINNERIKEYLNTYVHINFNNYNIVSSYLEKNLITLLKE